jgi:hydrogenase maturation protease
MTSETNNSVVVAGFGSPHGDDRAGWELVGRLARRPDVTARLISVREGTQLLNELDGCGWLIVVDACFGSGPPGTISRFEWPDPRIRRHHDRSTHQIGLTNALDFAQQLGQLPAQVVVFGVEGHNHGFIGPITSDVSCALDKLEDIVLGELEGAVNA